MTKKKERSIIPQTMGGVRVFEPVIIKTMSGSHVSLPITRIENGQVSMFSLSCDCESEGDAQAIMEALKRLLRNN